ncbi:MAG: MFS transporter, partial [bacterium]|nr:MFS transporter [bacterium]
MDSPVSCHPHHPRSLWQAVPASRYTLGFGIFNAVNYQIALTAPLILMARHWGGSEIYIGCVTALVPLLTTLQLYMAPRAEYIGFRRVMLMGWSGRNTVVGMTTLLPVLVYLGLVGPKTALEILFVLMLVFNTLRGLATASWMPWITWLVPRDWRGRYLSAEQLAINISSAFALFFCGWLLGERPGELQFAGAFLLSFTSGWISIYFLRRIDTPPPRKGKPLIEPPMTWMGRVWRNRPFRRLIRLNVWMALTIGAWSAFTIVFMRDVLRIHEGLILYMSSSYTLGAVGTAWGWGILTDRFGSRPVMFIASGLIMASVAGWLGLAALVLGPARSAGLLTGILGLYVLFGVGITGWTVAILRYTLNNAPKDRPVMALTLYSVVTSLGNAFAPVAWGFFLKYCGGLNTMIGPVRLINFTFFYALIIVMIGIGWPLIRRLPDGEAAATHLVLYHMVTDYPLRTIS